MAFAIHKFHIKFINCTLCLSLSASVSLSLLLSLSLTHTHTQTNKKQQLGCASENFQKHSTVSHPSHTHVFLIATGYNADNNFGKMSQLFWSLTRSDVSWVRHRDITPFKDSRIIAMNPTGFPSCIALTANSNLLSVVTFDGVAGHVLHKKFHTQCARMVIGMI